MPKPPEPLLPPGLHDASLEDIRQECVEQFGNGGEDNPEVRRYIMNRFEQYLSELASLNLELEIWINGSFVTEKPVPEDVDIVIFGDAAELQAEEEKRKLRRLIQDHPKQRYKTDAYWAQEGDSKLRDYWTRMFGTDRQGHPKGLYRLTLN